MARYRLTFQRDTPMNFAFGDVNVLIASKPTVVPEKYAQAIMQQYPGWIEKVPTGRPRKTSTPTTTPSE